MSHKVIEAAPGFYALDFYTKNLVNKIPVIGWVVDEDDPKSSMHPSVLRLGVVDYEYILMPNGEVCDEDGQTCTYEDWFEGQEYLYKERLKAARIAKGEEA